MPARLPVQYRDSRTRSADGFEFELAYVKAYIDADGAIFRQIANDAGVNISATNVASVNTTIPANNRSPDAQQAADQLQPDPDDEVVAGP